jgi:hypothetical protein
MADATDFVPKDADIEVNKAYFLDDVKNFASDKEIVSQTLQTVDEYDSRFQAQREMFAQESDGLWNQMDAAYRSFINDSAVQSMKKVGANEPDEWERAKIGSTLFHRQVTQMASNGYAVQTSRDMPFKYEALQDSDSVDNDASQAEERAKKLNLLAKWSMKKDKFNLKSIEFWTQIKKYGNIPVMVEWKHEMGTKKIRKPIYKDDDPTQVVDYETEVIDIIIENRPVFSLLPIESVRADAAIGNIQDQECVIVSTLASMGDIVNGISTGEYRADLLDDLNRSQQWDGFSGKENVDEKLENRDFENKPTFTETGQYRKWEVFVNVPIDEEKETWNILDNVPLRYRVTMFGNTAHESVVARIERNQEPDDTIPIEMIHSNPDDSDLLYHISPFEVIRGNMSAENTFIRQAIDNGTLINKPPQWEVEGEVQGNNREYGPNARYIVDNKDSIGWVNTPNLAQTNIQFIEYLKDDSNSANSIDKNMVGQSQGARTSATEAGNIASNSQRPPLVNIEYILEQLFGFLAPRYKVNWETYGLPEQIIQITDEDENLQFIRPTGISGEYDIVIDIMDDIKENAVEGQKLATYMQTVVANPELSKRQDWDSLADFYAETALGTSKFVIGSNDGDAEDGARRNIALMLEGGEYPQLSDTMNLKKHLEVYESERRRWVGAEEGNENLSILDAVIDQLEARIAQPPQQQGQQGPMVSQGEVNRQELSGTASGL